MSMGIMDESVDGSQYESIWGADKELKEGFRSRFQGLRVRHRRRMVSQSLSIRGGIYDDLQEVNYDYEAVASGLSPRPCKTKPGPLMRDIIFFHALTRAGREYTKQASLVRAEE